MIDRGLQSLTMATGYQAIARLRPVDVSPEREPQLLRLFGSTLPSGAKVETERDQDGQLLISVSLYRSAADASEVQIAVRDLVAAAAQRAGLSTEAALLDDIDVRASS